MRIEVLLNTEAVAKRAAAFLAEKAREAIAARGLFVMALSGGKTPWIMLRALADEALPWEKIHVVQVDERVAPAGHPDRNLTHLRESLLERAALREDQIHPMPVEPADLEAAAIRYARGLRAIAGTPPVLDLVHLGLGSDGHTASLVPGDPVLQVVDRDVAVTEAYQGRPRMTLTYPLLNRSREILWIVTGAEKAPMLKRLLEGDASIPAGGIRRDSALVLADRAAAGEENPDSSRKGGKGVLTEGCATGMEGCDGSQAEGS
ncbi:6-phosphogluconolactonase [uncultured Desulfatiglans sp.]|uniref:6-phosphogluconolactonase n=1 Tax=Uncultured Desulfatiglans sp. TaxID=1748965 RepID=A0A653AC82_UNCDX|nr:6-phosphogluconolactonase [uncultured Desulfatiglans sp.]